MISFSVLKDEDSVPACRLGFIKTLDLILLHHLVWHGIAYALYFNLRLMLVDDVTRVMLARSILLDSWQFCDQPILKCALILPFGSLWPAAEEISMRGNGTTKRTRYPFI